MVAHKLEITAPIATDTIQQNKKKHKGRREALHDVSSRALNVVHLPVTLHNNIIIEFRMWP